MDAQFHRKALFGLAMVFFSLSSLSVIGPLILPTTPLMDKFFGMAIPLQYQRAMAVLLGAFGLVMSIMLITFRPFAWWFLMVAGVIGVIQGLISVPAFLPTLLNILFVFYLYLMRPLYDPVRAVRAAPSR
jgi:hypothetical protein